MKPITTILELEEAIIILETKKISESKILKEEFKSTIESLKPANIIYSTVKDLVNLPNLKGNLLETSVSIAAGYLSKRAFSGNSTSKIKQIFGSVLQLAVTKVVAKASPDLKELAGKLLLSIFDKKEKIKD